MSKTDNARATIGPVVSSAHLATGALPALSEVEFGLIMASNAFNRWIVRCMGAAGWPDLSALDVLILHTVNHRDRAKKLADICLVLNIEDTHLVSYSLRKLEGQKLIKSGRQGKEKTVSITDAGEKACESYRKIREALLVKAVKAVGLEPEPLSETAALIRALSGHYDQAARAAAAM